MDADDFFHAEKIKPCLHVPLLRVKFDAAAWAPAEISGITNGWTYALDLPKAGDAKPGELMLSPNLWDVDTPRYLLGTSYTRDDIHSLVMRDGMHYLDDILPEADDGGEKHNTHIIGFFGRAGRKNSMPELLFVRRDDNGLWSMRPPVERGGCNGSGLPRQVDYQKQPITDPRIANFGPFNRFLGFTAIPYKGIDFYPRT